MPLESAARRKRHSRARVSLDQAKASLLQIAFTAVSCSAYDDGCGLRDGSTAAAECQLASYGNTEIRPSRATSSP